MIFGEFTLEIPLKFSACGGLGGAGFGFLKFHELGGARFGSRLRKIILRGVRALRGGRLMLTPWYWEISIIILVMFHSDSGRYFLWKRRTGYPHGASPKQKLPGFVRFRSRPVMPENLNAQFQIAQKREQI